MKWSPSVSLVGFLLSSGPTYSLGFVPTGRSVTLSSLKVEKPSPVFSQLRSPNSSQKSSTAINVVSPEVLASFLPPAMGFLKTEWTVSYGYGFSTAISALSLLLKQPLQFSITTVHAAALVFYGFRLNAFLYLRNRLSPRYREISEKIDDKAQEKYPSRISRAPFVLSCGLIFYGLYLPVKLTSDAIALKAATNLGLTAIKVLVGLQWFGYFIAALGDLTKSYVKSSERNGKFLVTTGIFSILRHPNFSGEILSWTCNSLCGALSAAYLLRRKFSLSTLAYLGLSTMGWASMVFVLLRATTNLEERQRKDYGDTEKYKEWVKNTWSGWKLSPGENTGKTENVDAMYSITMDAETEEDFGSGI